MATFDTKDPLGLESAYAKKSSPDNDPLGLESALLKKKVPSVTVSDNGSSLPQNGGINDQNSPEGFRTVTTDNKFAAVPKAAIMLSNPDDPNNPVEAEQRTQDEAQEQWDKEHPGSWKNALPTLFHATIGIVTKGVTSVADIARSHLGIPSPALYKEVNDFDDKGNLVGSHSELTEYGKSVDSGQITDPLGKFVIGMDAYNNETAKNDYENHLPKTFLGNTASGIINIAPIAATAALFPEAEAAEAGEATTAATDITALQRLKNIAVNPFTKVSAIQGGLNAYDEAIQQGKDPLEATKEAGVGAVTSGGQAAVYNILGEIGAKGLSPAIAKPLTESGLLKDGKLTKIGTDAAADAIVFSAYPIASNMIQGKPVDWNEVEQGLGTGLFFGGVKGMHTYTDFTDADKELKQTGDAVALKNFYDASPESIKDAYTLSVGPVELNVKAIEYAANAKKETDLDKRKQLIAASSMYQKMANLKTVTQSMIGDPSEFVNNINSSSDLTDEQKSGLINKIRELPKIINQQPATDPIQSLMDASPDDLVAAMQRPESAPQLQMLAQQKAQEMLNATEPEQKATLEAEHNQLQQHADIKNIGDAVMQHGIEPFIDAINNTDYPDDIKSTLINKAHAINQEFNPVIQKEIENKQTVAELTNRIDDLQNMPGATDPINNPTGTAELIDLVEQRTDKQIELLDNALKNPSQTINEQTQKEAETGSTAPEEGTRTSEPGKNLLEGGFQFKSKDYGILNIVPKENNQFEVHFDHDGTTFTGTPEDIKIMVPDFDETKIGAPEDIQTLHGTDNPNEIARLYDDKVRELKDTGSKEGAIAAYGPRTNAETFGSVNDPNNITNGIRLNYFRNSDHGTPALDVQADEINRQYFNGTDVVHPNDIAEFMIKYPGGERGFYTPSGNPELRDIAQRYKNITGKDINSKTARKLAAKYDSVTPNEIREIERKNAGAETVEKIKSFIKEHLDKPGLNDRDEVVESLEKEFERYLQDPNNEFNLFYDEFKGDLIDEDEQQQIRDAIAEEKDQQFTNSEDDTGSENETGSDAHGQDAEVGTGEQPEPVEDDLPFQRGKGEPIPQERIDAIQGLMKKAFPNVETIFHPTVEDFADAAKENGIDATELPNAFVDKEGKINFNPDAIHADTQIHEFGHILTRWAKENAPNLYNRMIAFGQDAGDIKSELRGNGYKISGIQLAEEAFVTMLARHGEGKLDEVIKNSGTRGTISKFINDLWTRFQRYIAEKTGFDIARFKNIKDMPINEFLDHINEKYLLSGTKISDIGTREYNQVDQQLPEKPARNEGESMADYFKRVIDWTKSQNEPEAKLEPSPFTLEENKIKPGYNYSETSIKNRTVAEERRARFLDEVESYNKRDFGTVWENGKKLIDDRQIDPAVFTENLIKNPRPLMPEETAALTYDRMRLYNDHQVTMDQINDAMETGNKAAETEARVRLSYIEERINNNDIAAKQAGYEQGLGLAARRMISAQDYSLANQIQLAKVANLGKELPEEVRKKLESLNEQLRIAEKKLADYEANAEAKATAISLARLKKEAEQEQRQERKQKRSQTQEQIKKNIDSIKSSIYDKLTKNKGTTSTILPYADKLAEITPDLAKLAKEYIKSGIVTIEGIVDAVHADIKDHLEGITKRDVRDALSGYGKTAKPSKDTIESQLRELKSQMRLTSALEDAQSGEKPLKSGYVHEQASEKVRELQKQVLAAMRENGIEVERTPISEEDAWKSALDSIKTRYKNQIEDLNKQLETGIKPDKKNPVILDKEAEELKAERDRLREAVKEAETNAGLTDEERVKLLLKSTEKSIEEYKERIGDLLNTGTDKKAQERKDKADALKRLIDSTPELKTLRDQLENLQDFHKELVKEGKPKLSPEEVALYAFKKRMAKKMADLQDRIDRGDYAKAPEKEPLVLDVDAKRLQADVFKLQRKFDEQREKIRLANRTKLEKRLDWLAKYRRFVLLASPTTVAKLTAAGATRLITSPLEEIAGHGLSLIPRLDKVSAKAPREGGGLNIQAEADSLAQVLSRRSIQEMYRTIKEGRSELDERVDDKDRTFKENSAFELPGRIHAALKTVPKQVEYYRSLNKRIAWSLRNGYDITSPDIQTSLQMESFKDQYPELFTGKTIGMNEIEKAAFNDSKRAIFMQDNFLSDNWQAMINRWETQGTKGEVAATMARIFLPIIKIPTNFVAESSSLAFGAVKAVFALSKGIDNLTPDQADYIMRALKKQSIGAAFFALGYMLPNNVGGFYRQGEKRKGNGPQADDLIIFGEAVPHWLMHAPVFELMQMGATVRRVHDEYEHNPSKTATDVALTSGLSAGKGLFGQTPLLGEPAELTRGLENEESLKKFSANFVLGLAVPYDVQRVARWMDEDSHGKTIPRKEKGFIQYMEGGIPYVRSHELKRK